MGVTVHHIRQSENLTDEVRFSLKAQNFGHTKQTCYTVLQSSLSCFSVMFYSRVESQGTFHPSLVSVLVTGPSLYLINFYRHVTIGLLLITCIFFYFKRAFLQANPVSSQFVWKIQYMYVLIASQPIRFCTYLLQCTCILTNFRISKLQ